MEKMVVRQEIFQELPQKKIDSGGWKIADRTSQFCIHQTKKEWLMVTMTHIIYVLVSHLGRRGYMMCFIFSYSAIHSLFVPLLSLTHSLTLSISLLYLCFVRILCFSYICIHVCISTPLFNCFSSSSCNERHTFCINLYLLILIYFLHR